MSGARARFDARAFRRVYAAPIFAPTDCPNYLTYADFAQAGDRTPLTRGPKVLEVFQGMNQSIAGAMDVLRAEAAALLPLPWTSTTPAGYVTRDAFERITAQASKPSEVSGSCSS